MSLEVKFTPEAEETFDLLMLQLKNKWGEGFVVDLENKILNSLSLISKNPFIHSIVIGQSEIRKCVLHKNCSMLYRVANDAIEIICFWDNRQEPIF